MSWIENLPEGRRQICLNILLDLYAARSESDAKASSSLQFEQLKTLNSSFSVSLLKDALRRMNEAGFVKSTNRKGRTHFYLTRNGLLLAEKVPVDQKKIGEAYKDLKAGRNKIQ